MKWIAVAGPIAFLYLTPTSEVQASALKVSAGNGYSCAIKSSGALYCWGDNTYGRLGDGTTTNRAAPTAVSGLSSGVTDVAAGTTATCAVVSGAAYCWGDNSYGQLGNGSTTASSTPVAVSGLTSGVTAIVVGRRFACALKSGDEYCWGDNGSGQVGVNSSTSYFNTPQLLYRYTTNTISQIVAAPDDDYACQLLLASSSYNRAYCWGSNTWGQLGTGGTANVSGLPTTFPIFFFTTSGSDVTSQVQSIVAGGGRTCAIVDDCRFCWGRGQSGALGTGSTSDQYNPVQISYANSSAALPNQLGGLQTAYFINYMSVSSASSIGDNTYGQLGNNSTTSSTSWVTIGFPSCHTSGTCPAVCNGSCPYQDVPITGLSVGEYHMCGRLNGAPYCWGNNAHGELGTNDGASYHSVPTAVSGSW